MELLPPVGTLNPDALGALLDYVAQVCMEEEQKDSGPPAPSDHPPTQKTGRE